ncbi:piRNA biogenesis protein EXD1-like [Acanthaster planci]|uniref:PiRNA biogenesis protein EXD1-like n=1 Tax=Acanthaster planci TaxID=133434 RepID=A0A8B7XUH1_ACAPL|nr:piRNA biogenesis protein EXD1-like [Acanthaster planci]XP_022084494.1 piRNA biogenesis protein EXD1-like [Acanthaster planci]
MATAGPPQERGDPGGMGPASCHYRLIDKESQIKPALDDIGRSPIIGVDCEGEALSRRGKLSVISIATADQIYLFDIVVLGKGIFDEGLRGILEDTARQKLMFDCRQDSDCLMHQYGVKLANVLDLQLLQMLDQEFEQSTILEEHPRVESFLSCLKEYVKDEDLIKAKEEGKEKMHRTDVWLERPLSGVMLKYAACDVMGFFKLYGELKHVYSGHNVQRLRVASDVYLDFFRSRPSRLYDEYEANAFFANVRDPRQGEPPFSFSSYRVRRLPS